MCDFNGSIPPLVMDFMEGNFSSMLGVVQPIFLSFFSTFADVLLMLCIFFVTLFYFSYIYVIFCSISEIFY